MKIQFITFVFILAPLILIGQRGVVSIGPEAVIPNDKFGLIANNGLGGSFRYEYSLNNHFTLTGTFDYLSFGEKNYSSPGSPTLSFKMSMFPIQAGAKFYFFSNSQIHKGFYASGEIGVNTLYFKATFNGLSDPSTDTNLNYAPGLGYKLGRFEINYRKQIVTNSQLNINYSSIRILYSFQRKLSIR